MVVSGELSMTRVFPVVLAPPVELVPPLVLELELDEQAASPAVSRPAAASAMSLLRRCNLLISVVLLSGFPLLWTMWSSCPHLAVARKRAPVPRRPGASRPHRACP